MPNYKLLKENLHYVEYINYGKNSEFCDLMIATLIECENKKFYSPLQFVKFLKDETQYGLKNCKDWYDMLKDLGFIYVNYDKSAFGIKEFGIKEYVNEINTMDDLAYIIKHDLSIEQFLRGIKLQRIKEKMKNINTLK